MSDRVLPGCLLAAALLLTPSVHRLAAAKPPDLPVNPLVTCTPQSAQPAALPITYPVGEEERSPILLLDGQEIETQNFLMAIGTAIVNGPFVPLYLEGAPRTFPTRRAPAKPVGRVKQFLPDRPIQGLTPAAGHPTSGLDIPLAVLPGDLLTEVNVPFSIGFVVPLVAPSQTRKTEMQARTTEQTELLREIRDGLRELNQTVGEVRDQLRQAPQSANPPCSTEPCPCGAWLDKARRWWQGRGNIHLYSTDPQRRVQELLNNSEDLREIERNWERIWFSDPPSHLTPERIHGGIQSRALPSPRYLQHPPQYFPPSPEFPLARELASQERSAATDKEDSVSRLLEACQQALAEGRIADARDLALEAFLLDPQGVTAHPLVYKTHLLQQLRAKSLSGSASASGTKGTEVVPAEGIGAGTGALIGGLVGSAIYQKEPPSETGRSGGLKTRTYPVRELVKGNGRKKSLEKVFSKLEESASVDPCETHAATTAEERLVRLITRTVAPTSWAETGGPATIEYYPPSQSLVIHQTPEVHEEIERLLLVLRRQQRELRDSKPRRDH